MAKINLAGANNAAQSGTVFNELQIAQSSVPTNVGIDMGGVHLQLGVNMNTDARTGWKDYVDGIYASLTRFNNTRPRFSVEELSTYLNMTFWADVAIAEARRDIMMLNAEDATLLSAKKDYFGPGFTENSGWDKSTQVVRFNSIVASYAAKFAHPTFPMKDILTYLVGNVFTDDTSARMNYIYFHCMNRSLHSVTPAIYQSLDALEGMLQAYDGIAAMSDITSDIHALILKVYGDAALMKAPIMNISDRVKFVYDATLLNALRNAYYVPELQPSAWITDGGQSGELDEGQWTTPHDSAAKLITNGSTSDYNNGPLLLYHMEQHSTTGPIIDPDVFNEKLNEQNRLLTGNVFKGADLCASLLFSQEVTFYVLSNTNPNSWTIYADASSHHGITIAHMWCNAMSQIDFGTWNQYWIRPHMLTLMVKNGQLDYYIPPTMAAALRAFSQCNAFRAQLSAVVKGTYIAAEHKFKVLKLASFGLCDPIDEFAAYNQVRLYTTPFARAYFKAGIDVYKPMIDLKTTDGSKPQASQKPKKPNPKNNSDSKEGEQK